MSETFTPPVEVFLLNPDAGARDIEDAYCERRVQAESMAHVMTDESFPCWAEEIQSNYVWALRRKIEEMGILHDSLMEQLKRERPLPTAR